jgi:uncharacterized delta-60 repeat protein
VVGGDRTVARFLSDGAPDPSFGTNGRITTDFTVGRLGLQLNGDVIAGGWGGKVGCGVDRSVPLVVARYNASGGADPSFGNGGEDRGDLELYRPCQFGLDVASDGSIAAAAGLPDGTIGVAHYSPDGSLDVGFGNGGTTTTKFGSEAIGTDVAVDPDGKVVVAGFVFPGSGPASVEFAVLRYSTRGELDGSFGGDGKVGTRFPPETDAAAFSVALQADGRIVVAGEQFASGGEDINFALARYKG